MGMKCYGVKGIRCSKCLTPHADINLPVESAGSWLREVEQALARSVCSRCGAALSGSTYVLEMNPDPERIFLANSQSKSITVQRSHAGTLRSAADEPLTPVTPEREECPLWVRPRSRRQPERPFSDPENLVRVDPRVLRFYDELHRRKCVGRKAA